LQATERFETKQFKLVSDSRQMLAALRSRPAGSKGERLLRDTTVELRRMRLGIQTAAPDPAPTEVAVDEPFASEGFCSGSSAAPDTAGSQPIACLEDSVWADRVRPPAAPTGRSRLLYRTQSDARAARGSLPDAPTLPHSHLRFF